MEDPEDEACGDTVIGYFDPTELSETAELIGVWTRIAVPPFGGCPIDLKTTLEHEMIHILRAQISADAEGALQNVHSEHGVFRGQWSSSDDILEETSAAMVCETGYCQKFELVDPAARTAL